MNEWESSSHLQFSGGSHVGGFIGVYRPPGFYGPIYSDAADSGGWAAEAAADAYRRGMAAQRAAQAIREAEEAARRRDLLAARKRELNAQKEDEEPMETLWQVLIVTKTRKVIDAGTVVAPDESGADFEADVAGQLRSNGLKPRDVTIIRKNLGQVAVEKEPQKMRLVKEWEPAESEG